MTALPPAVVVGFDSVTGLQVARILAARGVRIVGLVNDRSHFACRSRVRAELIQAGTRTMDLIEALESLGPRLEAPGVLIPCSDPAVLLISAHRRRLTPWFLVPLPEHRVVETLLDKALFHEFALSRGFPVPEGRVLRSRDDTVAAAEELSYPLVLKPNVKTAAWQGEVVGKAVKLSGPRQFLDAYDRVSRWAEALVAQEWIEGAYERLVSCYYVADARSQTLAALAVRTLRQWPSETGTCSLGEECGDEEVVRLITGLFEDVGFRGLGHVETKRDARSERVAIVELNVGRPTMRSPIAEAAGIEFHFTMYCDAAGLPVPTERRVRRPGVKWVYSKNDALAAARAWRQGSLTAREWLRSVRGPKVDAAFSWTDPVPFLADVGQTAGAVARRRGRAWIARLGGRSRRS